MCVAVATEAASQPSLVLNGQIQGGDIFAGMTINVVDGGAIVETVDPDGAETTEAADAAQITGSSYAVGNHLSATGAQGADFDVQWTQTLNGGIRAESTLNLEGETEGAVTLRARAEGNRVESAAYGADLAVGLTQTAGAVDIIADTELNGDPGRMLAGGAIDASAAANTSALAVSGGVLSGSVDQSASGFTQASVLGNPQYIPAPAAFTAQASGNVVAATGEASDMNLGIRQRQNGAQVVATSSGNAGNGWDLASRATANGNQIALYNQGGSLVAATDQANSAGVRGASITTAYDYGAATSHARANGNVVEIGNNDIHLQIDNAQLNTGGVEAAASFAGTNGYDAYVGADAAGNSITAYACADCAAYLGATSNQVNTANVTATATTSIAGPGRAIISGVNAVGNSATFYVTGNSGP